jgi:uncharacterized protein YjbJ (UPF0337 family)
MDNPREQKMEGSWKQFKGRIKEAWGTLSDDELDRLEGQRDQLEGLIEKRTGESRQKIRKEVDRLSTEAKYKF